MPARWRSPRTPWSWAVPIAFAVRAAAFTNLTQDHLDFHEDMEDYFAAKRVLFTGVEGRRDPPPVSVVNSTTRYGRRLAADLAEVETELTTISPSGAAADLSARDVAFDASGTRFELLAAGERDRCRSSSPLPGHFNVENALAAVGARPGARRSASPRRWPALRDAEPVPGRLEPIARGPAVRRAGRLRAHARLARERARPRPASWPRAG